MSLVQLGELLTWPEFESRNNLAKANGYWDSDVNIFPPGTGWYTPYVWDALNEIPEDHKRFIHVKTRGEVGYLSEHYWRDWANQRPPICIMCPNGRMWEIDRKSKNGSGWRVTGTWPRITCHPSIDLPGYHGWLQNGTFSVDVAGKGDRGIMAPYTPRPKSEEKQP